MNDTVLIYDGRCRFCVGQARRLARWIPDLKLESYRDPSVFARFPGLTPERCDSGLQVVDPGGRIHSGIEGLAVALSIRGSLRPLAWLLGVPGLRSLFGWGYAWIVRNRLRLGGEICDDDACATHIAPR